MLGNYTVYHLHSDLSSGITNIDSVTKFIEYVNAAKECGMKALAFSEHGNLFEWVHKKEAIEKAGMKYIHAVEAYLTEDISEVVVSQTADVILLDGVEHKNMPIYRSYEREDGALIGECSDDGKAELTGFIVPGTLKTKTEPNKLRDNYHCVLIAKNYDGVKELNKMVSRSFDRDDGHFYYMPRITIDELFATSDNIIVTSACLGGCFHNGTPSAKEKMLNFFRMNKHRCYFEIQHHNCKDQVEYNRLLYNLSIETGVPLIAGTDTHALNEWHMDGRALLQKSKGVSFENEDEWDLVFKTYSELIKSYEKQKSLPMEVVIEAIENTNRMAAMVEPFDLDRTPKYPKLYSDSEKAFLEKIKSGIKWRGIDKLDNYDKYQERIKYECETYKHNNAIDFMLLEEDYKSQMRKRKIRFGYSRGSVSGSIIAYLLGITEIDSVKYKLNFERFMNVERVSLADIDTDWYADDRDAVKDYLYHKAGLYCCDIVTFNTIALKGAIKDVCKGMRNDNMSRLPDGLKERIKNSMKKDKKSDEIEDARLIGAINAKFKEYSRFKEIPYDYIPKANEISELAEANEEAARKKYPEVFKYVDLVNGVIVSVGNHPAGLVVSPFPVDEWFGTFTTKNDIYPVSVLNMKEIDSLNFVKLDILGLDNIGLIYKTCDAVGIDFLTPDNTPPDDEKVWESIKEDTTTIFQWESASATAYLKQLFSDSTIKKIRQKNPDFSYMDLLSIGNGAIRPAGESYRNQLASGEYRTYGNAALDEFMKPTLGYCVYQEQIIEFLHKFCGFTMGEADVVRRHFSKKTGTDKDIPIIKDGGYLTDSKEHYIKGFIQTMKDDYGVERDEAEEIIKTFLQVIIDASDYLFSKNHADPYSWIGYICGYLRYYYPVEFITTALNVFEEDSKKSATIVEYAKKRGVKILPIKFRHSGAKYTSDVESNAIYKGIASIKYMNSEVANSLLELKDKPFNTFVDVLFYLKDNAISINARQIKCLIFLNYFEEFGEPNQLWELYLLFDKFYGKKQVKKDSLCELGFPLDICSGITSKETPKMFAGVDINEMLNRAIQYVKYDKLKLKQRIAAENEYLGYIDVHDRKYAGYAVVLDVNTRYTPRVKMYALKSGSVYECKINKKAFNKLKLKNGDIIRVKKQLKKPKYRMDESQKFVPVNGEKELWIEQYEIASDSIA